MKILLLGEYSGLNKELKAALQAYGHDVKLAAASDFWKKFEADINLGYGSNIFSYKLRQLILPFLRVNKLIGYDVVHLVNFYIFPRSPLLNLFLIKLLKKYNGKVTLSGAGDDPFFVNFSESTMRYSPIPSHEKHDRKKKYYMRADRHLAIMHNYMEYVDGVIPIMYEYYSAFIAAGYSKKTSAPIPIPINCCEIPFRENSLSEGKVTFFHGLNRPGFKGTFLIEKGFERLTAKYPRDVECIISGKMPFEKYMDLLSKVNVSVDQVFSYSLAMNALYSMAQGKVVAGGGENESSILYGGCMPPVYNLLPDVASILSVFEEILDDKSKISDRGMESRAFVEMFHNPCDVAEKYIKYWGSI